MRIATWNINGIKARIDGLVAWLRETTPDVVCLQEIKSVDEGFPAAEIEALGYNVVVHGQKGFNGVAILSKRPLEDVQRGLPGDLDDVQSRYIEAVVTGTRGVVRVGGLYLPNGNPIETEKFDYKLRWMRRLIAHARERLLLEDPFVLLGDYNVIPGDMDCKRPAAWTGDALAQPQSRALYAELLNLGFTDAIRACHPGAGIYTFWDYQAGAFPKDDGIRIDHVLLSPQAADRMTTAQIDRFTRAWEKPSDHVPVWVEMDV
jgi:exodeoxyribonuclease III